MSHDKSSTIPYTQLLGQYSWYLGNSVWYFLNYWRTEVCAMVTLSKNNLVTLKCNNSKLASMSRKFQQLWPFQVATVVLNVLFNITPAQHICIQHCSSFYWWLTQQKTFLIKSCNSMELISAYNLGPLMWVIMGS